MKNIHILPTDKTSRLWSNNLRRRLELDEFPSQHPTNIAKHIYITSDEEIKEGDYRLNIQRDYFKKSDKEGLDYYNKRNDVFKKVILTTDQDLIKDSVQAIDDEFLNWFVKNPNCDEVKLEYRYNFYAGKYLTHYKIIIPKEEPKQIKCYCGHTIMCDCSPLDEPKQETLEEAAEKYGNNIGNKNGTAQFDFIQGAKWQQERMYSEEDMFEFSQWISHEDWVYLPSKGYWVNEEQEELEQKLNSKEILNMWFEQFKKKV